MTAHEALQTFNVPGEILAPTAGCPAEHEVNDSAQRIDFYLEVAFEVAERINEHLNHFFGPEGSVVLRERGPGECVVQVEEYTPAAVIPNRVNTRSLDW